jgi:hypothetical protein
LAVSEACECDFFYEGDIVQHRLNHAVVGMVVGSTDFGRKYQVRLALSLVTVEFLGAEIEHRTAPENDGGDGDNIIDFTKAAANLRKAKPEGAA